VVDDYQPDPSGQSLTRPQLEYDVHEPAGRQLIVVQSPTLDDVVGALEGLDQQSRTSMTLIDGTGAYISVGGGGGRYHVYVGAFDHDDRVILQSPPTDRPGAPDPVDIVNDGHTNRYASHDVVDRETARAALTEFHHSGRPHLGLTWRT
jgi:hypothetical protein